MGVGAADGLPRVAVRRDGRPVPARAQAGNRAGGRTRAEGDARTGACDRRDLERQKLKRLRPARSATMDGVVIALQANIELPQDVKEANEAGAAGIGLFRSEFLFLNRDDLPSEDEQFEAYREVADAMHGRPVTIRTLDLGADKSINGADRGGPNPALGLRAIRFCLAEPQMV